ncbi:MAG: protease modulator HflC [Thermoguttaceae bacterium]|nr:protease modulator HflC [Thermoguttaceae bacterium]MDW8079880.1 protease modulator HflC [Thermoguttaceae bacterium]
MTRLFPAIITLAIVVVVLWILLTNVLFTVDERELAVVLQFGEPVAGYTEPGLKWKLPFIQQVERLPKTYQFWLGTGREILVDVPTADGKKVEVTLWAIWRITDPIRFIQELRTVSNAEQRIKDFVRSEVRDVITAHNLIEVVRSTNRKLTYTLQVEAPVQVGGDGALRPEAPSPNPQETVITPLQPGVTETVRLGRQKLVEQAKAGVQQTLGRDSQGRNISRGIELVDLGIARIDFVPAVQEAAFRRLIAFLESVAAYYVNEGQRRKQEILNLTNYEVEKILGDGKREANRIRGEVEAEVIQMYAEAIREMGEFYQFVRTLEVYKKAIGPNTRLVVTTDSDIFSFFRRLSEGPKLPVASAVGQAPVTTPTGASSPP